MAHDPFQETPPSARSGAATLRLLLVGVAAAAILGVGLGIWARPGDEERRAAVEPAAAPVIPNRRVAIVVDDHQASVGAPMEVMSAAAAQQAAAAVSPAPDGDAVAPPPELVRVQAPEPAPEPARVDPATAVDPTRQPPRATKRVAHPAALVQVARHAARKPETSTTHKAGTARAAPHETRAEPTKHAAPAARRSRLLAGKAAQKAASVKAVRKPPAKPRLVRMAPAPKPPVRPVPRGSGPLHLISAEVRCASSDPGAALVCSDPALGAAERQLNRVYRAAEAAGVPVGRLQQEQRRLLASRAAAARLTPWAVRDVYAARIAELQDLTRQAKGGGS